MGIPQIERHIQSVSFSKVFISSIRRKGFERLNHGFYIVLCIKPQEWYVYTGLMILLELGF